MAVVDGLLDGFGVETLRALLRTIRQDVVVLGECRRDEDENRQEGDDGGAYIHNVCDLGYGVTG